MKLINADLAPVSLKNRTWGSYHYFSLWAGMAICIPTYMIASSLIAQGMSLSQAMLCVFLGNLIVLAPMILIGMAGTRYGIPYPILARASFGVLGANIPAVLRALVACGWFGINTWVGGGAVHAALTTAFPSFNEVESGRFLSFLIFWAINVYFIVRGMESIKALEGWAAPLLLLSGLALLGWAVNVAGFQTLVEQTTSVQPHADFLSVFVPSLTAMIGYWATMSLNMPDFTRYAKNQKSQALGQLLGLPATMTLFAFIGVTVTKATEITYGIAIWDPVELVKRFDSPFVIIISMILVAIATLTTNIAANVVGSANDFSNLAPEKISFRVGGLITAFGIAMMPWKLVADPHGYIFTWLIGYSSLLGPIGGILLADYFLVRKQRLDLDGLYRLEGPYCYNAGINHRAIAAFILGVLPSIPGFLVTVEIVEKVPEIFMTLYSFSWFVGIVIAGGAYVALMKETQNQMESLKSSQTKSGLT